MASPGSGRPRVSVVVPFYGDAEDARATLGTLSSLRLRDGDELFVVDNTPDSVCADTVSFPGTVLVASVPRSAYAARNEGAEHASGEWLLFLDADCRPAPDLIDAFFSTPPSSRCGGIAGEIRALAGQRGLAPAYARSRGYLTLAVHAGHPHLPIAATANFLVRRGVWQELGGFPEGMTAAGGDTWFSWQLQERGWELCQQAAAVVEHRHRETVAQLLRQVSRNAAGAEWVNRRRSGAIPIPGLIGPLPRSLAAASAFAITARGRRALFKLVDALVIAAQNVGRLRSNSAPIRLDPPVYGVAAVFASFPASGDRAVLALAEALPGAPLEAAGRASVADWTAGRRLIASFWEDDGPARKAAAVAWLFLRHPLRALRGVRPGWPERGPVLPALAPAARRLSRRRIAVLVPAPDAASADLAQRLSRLLGIATRPVDEVVRGSGFGT